jgi:hypothetical protein
MHREGSARKSDCEMGGHISTAEDSREALTLDIAACDAMFRQIVLKQVTSAWGVSPASAGLMSSLRRCGSRDGGAGEGGGGGVAHAHGSRGAQGLSCEGGGGV